VFFGGGLTHMASRTLTVVERAGKRLPALVLIALPVWIVTVHTRHRAGVVTRAVEMILLIGERAHPAVRSEWAVSYEGRLEREVVLEGCTGQVPGPQSALECVALEADPHGLVLAEGPRAT
jgi:hypothetical protein